MAVVITGTPRRGDAGGVLVEEIVHQLQRDLPGRPRAVDAAASSGLFLNQRVLARRQLGSDDVAQTLRSLKTASGGPLFQDAFSSVSVLFSRYCE